MGYCPHPSNQLNGFYLEDILVFRLGYGVYENVPPGITWLEYMNAFKKHVGCFDVGINSFFLSVFTIPETESFFKEIHDPLKLRDCGRAI